MLLAEANQWPEDAVAYFGDGDECHMAFHFPLMPRLFMALHMEDRFPILDILAQTPAIPETCQWALFLRNHDELTLEMVTDEERDYMYRAYAHDPRGADQPRHPPPAGAAAGQQPPPDRADERPAVLAARHAVLYYGDEIGMGDNIYLGDRNGVRTPMQWSADRNAGFSRANPQQLYLPVIIDPEYHYEAVNVEAQQNNPHSLLWWMKRLIALRKRHQAFGRGHAGVPRTRTTTRSWPSSAATRTSDSSSSPTCRASSSTSSWTCARSGAWCRSSCSAGRRSRRRRRPYSLTLGPHAFYWFALEPEPDIVVRRLARPDAAGPRGPDDSWEDLLGADLRVALEAISLAIFRPAPGSPARVGGSWRRGSWRSSPCPHESTQSYATFVRVDYADGEPETYSSPSPLPPTTSLRPGTVRRTRSSPKCDGLDEQAVEGVLVDAARTPIFLTALLNAIARGDNRFRGVAGEIVATRTPAFQPDRRPAPTGAAASHRRGRAEPHVGPSTATSSS